MSVSAATSAMPFCRLRAVAAPSKVCSPTQSHGSCMLSFPFWDTSSNLKGSCFGRKGPIWGPLRCGGCGVTDTPGSVSHSGWLFRLVQRHSFCSQSFPGLPQKSLVILLKQKESQSRAELHAAASASNKDSGLPFLSLESYDAYRRQIRFIVEEAVGPRRRSEFRSLRLVTRSMSGLHFTFLVFLLAAPPTSLELLLSPHSQFCCLCLAQTASCTFWGFGLARPGPLASAGLAVGDWRLAVGLLYLWVCTVALIASLKDPKTSYEIQIPGLLLLLLLQRRLGSPQSCGVPTWWAKGSQQQMLLALLACTVAALGRCLYVESRLGAILDSALCD